MRRNRRSLITMFSDDDIPGVSFLLKPRAVPEFDYAVGRSLDVPVYRHRADAVRHDAAGHRILYVGDASADVGMDGAVLKGTVTVLAEGAVLQDKIMGIAERLLAGDVAVDQTQIPRMPAEILSIQFRVVDRDILNLPEGVLRGDLEVAQLGVLHILEYIFAFAVKSVHTDVAAEHERIGATSQSEIADIDAGAFPEHLVGIVHHHILKFQIRHLAKHLRRIDHRVRHLEVVRIPEGRTAADGKTAVLDSEPVNMPERIVALEQAVDGLDVATLLDSRLTGTDDDVLESEVMRGEKRTLPSEFLILNRFHICLYFQFHYHIFLFTLAGTPTATESAGTS